MTPKSLLRHPKAVSSLEDCAKGTFQRVLPDTSASSQTSRRILLCTGKIYYDLDAYRTETKRNDVDIIRLDSSIRFAAIFWNLLFRPTQRTCPSFGSRKSLKIWVP